MAKRKLPTSEEPQDKKVPKRPRQSDIAAGFAVQLLRSPQKDRKQTRRQANFDALEIDDAIEISSDEEPTRSLQRSSTQSHLNVKYKKRIGVQASRQSDFATSDRTEVDDKARSLRNATRGSRASASTQTEGESDPYGESSWLGRRPIIKPADLAVHKRKVTDVGSWITRSFSNISQHTVLVLTGPAGVGKTATIEALATEMDFDIIEWRNPMSTEWMDNAYDRDADGLAQKFERFLAISDKYSALDFGDGMTKNSEERRKVIVVEDLPNTFSSSSGANSAKLAFQTSIMRYLSSPRNKYPLILIITETEPRSDDGNWRRSDAMSVRNLLPREVLEAANCTQIPFNDVAPTFISKALARIVDNLPLSEAVDVTQAVLDEISQHANGDLRSAINTLQFISHRFTTNGQRPKPRKKKKRGEILTLTPAESSILNIITNRESALDYFHAIGKVVYNKRIPDSLNPSPYDSLPPHLLPESRSRPETDPESILESSSTDIPTFLMGVHRNFVQSTTSPLEVSQVLEHLSFADSLTRGFDASMSTIWMTGAQIAVSGTLQAIPENCKRWTMTHDKIGAATAAVGGVVAKKKWGGEEKGVPKIYFPSFSDLRNRQFEIQDLVDRFADAYYRLSNSPDSQGIKSSADGAVGIGRRGSNAAGAVVEVLERMSAVFHIHERFKTQEPQFPTTHPSGARESGTSKQVDRSRIGRGSGDGVAYLMRAVTFERNSTLGVLPGPPEPHKPTHRDGSKKVRDSEVSRGYAREARKGEELPDDEIEES